MKHRRFHEGEEVRVGPQACDRRMVGRVCKIEGLLRPIEGEHRYTVSTASGMSTIVLEASLQKILVRWDDCVWQPRRVR
jgi:hypothetical protein